MIDSRIVAAAVTALILCPRPAPAQALDLAKVAAEWRLPRNSVNVLTENGRQVLRFGENAEGGMVSTQAIDLADGDIEFDVRGRDVLQKSFVGVAFRIENDTAFDMIYLRPFNFRATDSTRHAHAVQYVGAPEYGWQRLRNEHPGMFECAIVPEPDPNGWVHVKVEVRGQTVRAFIDRAARPNLEVRTPSGLTHGGVGLWVGPESNGDFANVSITRLR